MNLRKGSMTISPTETDVVQHVALAFVTATLYLLVQPRPPGTVPETLQAVKRGDKKVGRRPHQTSGLTISRGSNFPFFQIKPIYQDNGECVMLYYCGWQEIQSLPSNSYIRWAVRVVVEIFAC